MKRSSRIEINNRCTKPHILTWAIASTEGGERSICPCGWHMTTSHDPFMVAISLHFGRFTNELIRRSKEFILAFPGENQAGITLELGSISGRDTDKIEKYGLTAVAADFCSTPIIEECIVNLECKLAHTLDTGDHTVFVGQVMQYWEAGNDHRALLSVDDSSGYEQLLNDKGYQFGVIKK